MTTNTVTITAKSYLTEHAQHYSPQLLAANSQALSLFLNFLTDSGYKPHQTNLAHLNEIWAYDFLTFLQQTRSVETEHLYSRAIFTFYTYAHQQSEAISQTTLQNLRQFFSTHRRTKPHGVPQPPIDAIRSLIQYVNSTPLPTHTQSARRILLQHLRDRALLNLLTSTGLRTSEISTLRKTQLNLTTKQITTTDGFPIPIPAHDNAMLNHYLAERASLDTSQSQTPTLLLPVFARHDKKAGKHVLPISRWTVANIVNHWSKLALSPELSRQLAQQNQRLTPYTLRHYFVITTLSQTNNLNTTMHLARHRDQATTRHYLKHRPK